VSVNAAGTQTGSYSGGSSNPVFSPDGTKVAFQSAAPDLVVTADANFRPDVFVRDLTTGVTTLISTNAAGTQAANGASGSPVFSPDGTKVAYGIHGLEQQ
jgi:Tol biopolymer transport system component